MAQQHHLNAVPHPQPKEFEAVRAAIPGGSQVWVSQQAAGAHVTQVKQSTMTSNNLYWLNVSLSKVAHNVEFVVTFKAGSPLTNQSQQFTFPGGYGAIITTPFGVPFWGGDPILGPAVLTVLADGSPVGSYNFTVVP